jgi:signal transduction histidine kinase
VSDNGIGIDPEYQKQIFEVFKRLHTRKEYPGSGIGLSISQKIINRHDGRIWVESELGKGSTFYFTLPLIHGE